MKKNISSQKNKIIALDNASNFNPDQSVKVGNRSQKSKFNFQRNFIVYLILLSVLPVVLLGSLTYLNNNRIAREIVQGNVSNNNVDLIQSNFQKKSLWLLIVTGTIAGLSGTIAFIFAESTLRPMLQLREISRRVVKRLNPEESNNSQLDYEEDELTALEANLYVIEQQIPNLLWQQEEETERFELLIKIICRLQQSRSTEEVFNNAVEEIRQAYKVERVAILHFDRQDQATFVAESVAANLPKIIWKKIANPNFYPEELEEFGQGKVQAINDIYQTDLNEKDLNFWERFGVKSHLIAPIIKEKQLLGLLFIQQCSYSHYWQPKEINLISQIANQIGFSLIFAHQLEELDLRATRSQQLIEFSSQIRSALTEEEIFQITVEQMRKFLNSDRVIVYSFDRDWYGTVVAESVLLGLPKALGREIEDPCFAEGYVEKYQARRVQVTDNIYEAGLTECYLKQLESFAVKAHLVAPILKDNRLFGLLIAHQCSHPRHWQLSEIDLFTQVATQCGFALDRVKLLEKLDAQVQRNQLLANITCSIRASLVEEQILNTTVEEVRKALKSDRVIVYSFDRDWYGTVVAESVLLGLPKALGREIEDPCFAEGYVEKYQARRVQVTDNIYEAGLTECYLKQLESFAVKAHLVAPILKDNRLFGLLIAHQCFRPRHWQEWEINFLAQIALQVGFALDHSGLLQQAEILAQQQNQQKQAVLQQVSNLLYQTESIQIIYEQTQALTNTAEQIKTTIGQVETEAQNWQQAITIVEQIINHQFRLEQKLVSTFNQLKHLQKLFPQIIELFNVFANTTSSIQVQGMNGVLEAARGQNNPPQFASFCQNVHSLAQQLEQNLQTIQPLLTSLQSNIASETNTLTKSVTSTDLEQLQQQAEQQLQHLTLVSSRIQTLLNNLAQSSRQQLEKIKSIEESIQSIQINESKLN